ncbi:MAG: invasin domain 3-containing protein [bacterium]|nr:invasin domain 3-containing protein [bacterium]
MLRKWFFSLCALIITFVGCEKKPPTVAPAPVINILSLVAEPDSIPADGASSSIITATVKYSDGRPADGLEVKFITSLGKITTPDTTDSNGVATATLTSGTIAGMARVDASCGNKLKSIYVQFTSITGEVYIYSLTADPPSIPAGGSYTSTITANVKYQANNNPAPGFVINFSTDLGTITQIDTTDSTGNAFAILTSGTTPGTAFVKAWYSQTVRDSIQVEFTVSDTDLYIYSMTAEPSSIPADGISTSIITANLRYTNNNPAPGFVINFSTNLGTITPVDSTDSVGNAFAVLTSSAVPGVAIVKAWYSPIVKDSVLLTFTVVGDTVPASVVVYWIDYTSIYVHGTGSNETSTIIFQVRDREGNPVSGIKTVDFAIVGGPGGGEYLWPTSASTESLALVTTHLNSGTISGPVRIVASVQGTSISSSPVRIVILGGPPVQEHFSLATEKRNLYALWYAGVEDIITAYVGDQYGNPVPDNTIVWFTTQCGIIQPGSGVTSNGITSNTLISCAPWPLTGLFYVYGWTIDGNGSTIKDSVRVLWSHDTMLKLLPDSFNIPNAGNASFIYTLRDINGNPLTGGTAIQVSATAGELRGDIDVKIPDTQSPAWTQFSFSLWDDEPDTVNLRRSKILVDVTSDNGNASAAVYGEIY